MFHGLLSRAIRTCRRSPAMNKKHSKSIPLNEVILSHYALLPCAACGDKRQALYLSHWTKTSSHPYDTQAHYYTDLACRHPLHNTYIQHRSTERAFVFAQPVNVCVCVFVYLYCMWCAARFITQSECSRHAKQTERRENSFLRIYISFFGKQTNVDLMPLVRLFVAVSFPFAIRRNGLKSGWHRNSSFLAFIHSSVLCTFELMYLCRIISVHTNIQRHCCNWKYIRI